MTKKNLPAARLVDRDQAPELPELSDELRLAFSELAGAAREGLLAMSVSVGMRVLVEMMEEELTTKVGPKHAKLPERTATRHSSAPGSVVLGGRRLKVQRPRARTTEGTEVRLDTYATFADDDVLSAVVMERMLAGLATRRHRAANEPVGTEVEAQARSTSKSSVSRRFVAKTKKALEELMARDVSELDVVALMLDGVNFAEHCCVVALAICADGTKVPVGLWLGDTENKTVVTHLLADLVDRGLTADHGLLVVIDGAKALATAVRKVFGDAALIQRCTLHKRRNVGDHLPEAERGWVDARLAKAFNHADPAAGLRMARDLARQLETRWPDAAASLREGMEDMFTVRRLGVGDRLARTLTSTNPIESMISVGRSTTHNVKRWRDGTMVKRWAAAGMLNAERSFRRVKGCKEMPKLVEALLRHVDPVVTPSCDNERAA
ncbi:MAG TPA: IS256 family transposase [Acidimicrobiales bacterium]|nr:IS256 family transposase [Acidimicrobiales bacterium]